MDDEIGGLLRESIVNLDDGSLHRLVAAGPVTVTRFRDFLDGSGKLDLPQGRSREFIDNVMAVSCRLAAQFPDEYLATFNDHRWRKSGAVLAGLGNTRRREAIPLLVYVLGSDARWGVRLDAARALGMFSEPDAVAALLRALDDDEHLVQYHAIQSLGQIGDLEALDRLAALAASATSGPLRDHAASAAEHLASRLEGGGA